jgi:CDGSH-type Zn-finger protein
MNDKPVIFSTHSIKVEVKEGEKYFWCSCGRSATQPFCDGSHAGTTFSPIEYNAEKTGVVGFCGCKLSSKGPICDGAHKKLNI